jgi:hypothetical protein
LCSLADRGAEASGLIADWAWQNVAASDVWPKKLPPDLAALLAKLQEATDGARSGAGALFDRLCLGVSIFERLHAADRVVSGDDPRDPLRLFAET